MGVQLPAAVGVGLPVARCTLLCGHGPLRGKRLHLPVWPPFSHRGKGVPIVPPRRPREGSRVSGDGRCWVSPFSPGHRAAPRKAELVSPCMLAVHLSCPGDSGPLWAPLPPTPPLASVVLVPPLPTKGATLSPISVRGDQMNLLLSSSPCWFGHLHVFIVLRRV